MIYALRKEIYRLLKTVSGLDSSNVFYGRAPQKQMTKYCVFMEYATPNSWDSGTKYEVVYVQFSVYGSKLRDVEAISESIQSVFDFKSESFSITGYDSVSCTRQSNQRARKSESDKWWNEITQYKIEIQKAR